MTNRVEANGQGKAKKKEKTPHTCSTCRSLGTGISRIYCLKDRLSVQLDTHCRMWKERSKEA